ncbi:Frag1/DRAM/Sfk1 family-domain-containing protein [Lophiotrema nucula]|uniref:Frag1/DRAM/Sfk1 family-domain-containing protein n=1 Tax=Lophiotrema nucula TaxID=690887 RepID=A0A6A5YPF0_9PLEO|nr:Frag1/DRAM/Sfk1 family-domain-containing protein [Lophiotrema nucula]
MGLSSLAWIVPVFSACVWLAMLIAMIVTWSVQGFPQYPSMDPNQKIAYISDIGASGLKPLFIAMSIVTVVSFDLVFVFERWLRHTGRLAHNTSVWQKVYSICSIIAAIAGAAGLILLSIFDTRHHHNLHDAFLVLFIGGYIISAIFVCWEYQRLGIHFRQHSILRISFWIKLSFILLEVCLAIAFGVLGNQKKWNAAAIMEWIIALVYFFYVLSYFVDFLPALRNKHDKRTGPTEMDMARMESGGDAAADGQRYYRGGQTNGRTNGATNGYTNGATNGLNNGYTNGHGASEYPKPPETYPASRNF